MRPLEGLFVLDFSTLLPGPMATLLLAEAGAEVVKLERPGGEEMRGFTPRWGADSVNFALLNRGKKSVAFDLKSAEGLAGARNLAARADVIVEQFRPGVMDRLGLGYAAIAERNPRAIYCSITGYGQTGPKRDVAGHDLNYIGDSGLLALSYGDPSRAIVPPALIADIAGGAYPAFMNILLALQERQRTGRGRHLDVAMSDNVFPFAFWALGQGLSENGWPGNGTDLFTGGTPRYHLFATRDGKTVAAAAIEQKFWETFCDILGLEPELRNDAAAPARTMARIAEIIASEDAAVWATRFAGRDCCCSVVADIREALDDPHFRARGLFDHRVSNERGDAIVALPVPIDRAFRAPAGTPLAAPALGAHTREFTK